jgi:hypothetical protein
MKYHCRIVPVCDLCGNEWSPDDEVIPIEVEGFQLKKGQCSAIENIRKDAIGNIESASLCGWDVYTFNHEKRIFCRNCKREAIKQAIFNQHKPDEPTVQHPCDDSPVDMKGFPELPKDDLYQELSMILTDYENNRDNVYADDLHDLLTKIQHEWDAAIDVDEAV